MMKVTEVEAVRSKCPLNNQTAVLLRYESKGIANGFAK